MAATVVSVVIFLCGVLVGRGVRAERGSASDAAAANDVAAAEITPSQPPVPATSTPAASDATAAAPAPPAEDASYFRRLDDPKPPQDTKAAKLAVQAAAPAPAAASNAGPAPAPPVPAAKAPAKGNAAAPAASVKEPTSSADTQPPPGFAVQIAALNVRSEADAIAKHLASKGYSAYVSTSGAMFRVRVGTFKTRREAETVAARLQKEEQLKPWVTR